MAAIESPYKQVTTVTSDDDGQVILGPIDVQGYSNLGFYVQNSLEGGDALASATLQSGPTATGPWVSADALAAALASPDAEFTSVADACHKFIRVVAACANGDATQVTTWLCASQRG